MGRLSNQVERKCRNCFATFLFKPSQAKAYPNAGRYCSRQCGYDYRVKKNALRPSDDKYGRTRRVADIAWVDAVKSRDNYTCKKCGAKPDVVHAHHIATRRQRPDLIHELTNGVTLCGSCHQWVHRNPMKAAELGFLSNARYELAMENKRLAKIIAMNKARSHG